MFYCSRINTVLFITLRGYENIVASRIFVNNYIYGLKNSILYDFVVKIEHLLETRKLVNIKYYIIQNY